MSKRKLQKNYIEYEGQKYHERSDLDITELALELVKDVPKGRVLDLAAGSGFLSKRLSVLGFETIAYDINSEQFVPTEIPIKTADLNNSIPEADESLEAVLAIEVIEHLENPRSFLREIGRMVKPGGVVILSTPNIVSLKSKFLFFFREELNLFFNDISRTKDPFCDEASGHITPQLPWLLNFFLNEAGFKIESTTYSKKFGIRNKHLGKSLLLLARKSVAA